MIQDVQESIRETLLGRDTTDGSLVAVGASATLLVATIVSFLVWPVFSLPLVGAFCS